MKVGNPLICCNNFKGTPKKRIFFIDLLKLSLKLHFFIEQTDLIINIPPLRKIALPQFL